MIRLSKGLITIILLLIISGCANLNYRPPLEPAFVPNPKKSYVYGRFNLERDFMNKVRLALQIENMVNGSILSLRLLDKQQVYAVEVEPGTYKLKGFVYALLGAVMEFETSKIPLPVQPAFLKDRFSVEPGKAYYLGDYYGSSRRNSIVANPVFVNVTFRGGILGITQNFSKTTDELKTVLSGLTNIEFKEAWSVSKAN